MDKLKEQRNQKYNEYVEQITPKHNVWLNCLKAFLVGGIICTIGQMIFNLVLNRGVSDEIAGNWMGIILILISVLLTGFNIYPSIAKFGGAGALVPSTGFANSVAAPAIEYKKEGHIFGIGCKIFTIAGPVILFGLLTSWVTGVIYYILTKVGIWG